MIIYSRFNRPIFGGLCLGDTTVVLEDTEVVQDGVRVVIPKGVVNLYDKVQADKEATNIYKILDRFARGDISALSQRIGQFIDTVNMPKSIIEAHKQLDTMKKGFESMPADFREKFDFSFDKFVEKGAKMSKDDWANLMPKKPVEPAKEVDNESK